LKIQHVPTLPRVARVSVKTDTEQRLVKLGDAVREFRKARGLSQEALADAAGIDRSHMSQIERGKRNISFLNVLRIADAMGVKASDIIAAACL
jgi:transcriptional regulator with XRE-family HTH domain